MMGKTHIVMGVATATAITYLPDLSDAPFTAAVIGGTVGGIVCDVDTESNSHCRDALYSRIVAGIVVLTTVGIDFVAGLGVCDDIINGNYYVSVLGSVIFLVICIVGYFTSHRTFTHSILAMIIWGISLGMICIPLVPFFIAGFLSHIVLDVLNKKKVPIFYPIGDGFCLGICYADKAANKGFLIAGTLLSIGLIMTKMIGTSLFLTI